jgi:hypothetical protein
MPVNEKEVKGQRDLNEARNNTRVHTIERGKGVANETVS